MTFSAPILLDRTGDAISNKYVLDRLLGVGGMGEVWEATNVHLHARVAIKLIRPSLGDEISHGRLLQEARSAAQLSHPAIIRIFDVGETQDGAPYIVMERLEGQSLREQFDSETRPDIVSVVQTLLPILDALALAHQRGLVHRDVKPDNIFLSRVGKHRVQPKLLDFGLAKERTVSRQFTTDGTVVGSPPYMSPEQAAGDGETESAADLWAVNVILYEAACGELPFMADNYNKLMRLIVDEEAPPLPQTSSLLASLAPIVGKGLAKNPTERWQTAEELGEALAAWLLDHGVGEDATGARVTGRWDLHLRPSHTLVRKSQSMPIGSRGVATHAAPASHRLKAFSWRTALWGVSAVVLLATAAVLSWLFAGGLDERTDMNPAPTEPTLGVGLTATGEAKPQTPTAGTTNAVDEPPSSAAPTMPVAATPPRDAKPANAARPGAPPARRRPQASPQPSSPKEESAEDLGLKNPY